jgi:hypothetical protein
LFDGFERARDVRTERVVLRLVDLAAGRQKDDQRCCDRGRRGDDGADRVPQPRTVAMPHRERDQQAHRSRTRDRDHDEVDEVRRERVPRLVSHVLQVQAPAVRDLRHRTTVDGPEIDLESDGQPDRILEPHAPVHERHVEVKRALVPGVDRDLDLPDRQVLGLRVRVQRDVRGPQRGGDDYCHGQRMPRDLDGASQALRIGPRQSRPRPSWLQYACW